MKLLLRAPIIHMGAPVSSKILPTCADFPASEAAPLISVVALSSNRLLQQKVSASLGYVVVIRRAPIGELNRQRVGGFLHVPHYPY